MPEPTRRCATCDHYAHARPLILSDALTCEGSRLMLTPSALPGAGPGSRMAIDQAESLGIVDSDIAHILRRILAASRVSIVVEG